MEETIKYFRLFTLSAYIAEEKGNYGDVAAMEYIGHCYPKRFLFCGLQCRKTRFLIHNRKST